MLKHSKITNLSKTKLTNCSANPV